MSPQFNVIGLIVADMPASLAFYRRLGFDIPAEADAERHVEAALPGGLRLTWDVEGLIRMLDPAWTPPVGGARIALAFECASPAEVDSVYADLVEGGAHGHLPPWDAVWRQRYATLHDPDGNSIDLYAAL